MLGSSGKESRSSSKPRSRRGMHMAWLSLLLFQQSRLEIMLVVLLKRFQHVSCLVTTRDVYVAVPRLHELRLQFFKRTL